MPRAKLRQLIVPKPMPRDVTLSLTRSFDDPRETVGTYWFTDTIRGYMERIMERGAQGRGQGYWIEAEYGAGKTHFLATLACLLAHTDDQALWDCVRDDAIRNYRRRLAGQRFFPVVLALKGHSGVDSEAGRMLWSVLEREGFAPALQRVGLQGRVQITSAEELLAWFDARGPDLRTAIERYVRQETGLTAEDYAADQGRRALADVIRRYCADNDFQPDTSASIKDRLVHIFRQLTAPGLVDPGVAPYTGLLVVIDEWEFWQRLHSAGTSAAAHDEEVLETLSFVLAKDLGLPVLTLVGSQTVVPPKLRGGQEGDRFISMPLLKGVGEREYDVIVSHRVRELDPERAPELDQYYDYYVGQFQFARSLDRQRFADIFPFQPRCFDVVRRITARELPAARSGIYIMHQALYDGTALGRDTLLVASDVLESRHLQEALNTPVYKEAYEAYRAALEALPSLNLEAEDLPLAERLLKTLFLWHLAFLEVPQSQTLSLEELVEATLTSSDFLRSEDLVALVLDQMSALPQIEFKDRSARFVVAGVGTEPFFVKFERYKRPITDPYQMQQAWQDSLFFSQAETGGAQSLWGQFECDKPRSSKVTHGRIEYPGEVLVATRWRAEYGQALGTEDLHFRLVVLTQYDQQVAAADLKDSRIAVLLPGALGQESYEAAREYMAAQAMAEDYRTRVGQEADDVRQELQARKRPEVMRNLLETQVRVYRAGSVVTQQGLGINATEVFNQPNNDRRIEYVVDKLLASAYRSAPVDPERLRHDFTAADAGKVFEGLFNPQAGKAEESALDNFAVGLGLARPEHPRRFDPTDRSALPIIAQMLRDAGGGEIQTWRIYERLAGPPYGLPYALITLYLLCFVRHSQEPVVSLHLRPGHTLRLRSGDPPPRDTLSRGNVVQLAWKSGMHRAFDLLAPTEDVWPQVVPFGRVLLNDLVIGDDTGEVERQQARLAEALAILRGQVQQTTRQLDLLRAAFGRPLAAEDQAALGKVAAVAQSDTYLSFYERLGESYTQPEALQEDIAVLHRLAELALAAAEIQAVKSYLDQVETTALPGELAGDLTALRGQLGLETLAGQPGLWPALHEQFKRFRQRYRNEYRIHHRDFYKAIQEIRQRLDPVPRRLRALDLLNGISDLGHPLGSELPGRLIALQDRLKACGLAVGDVQVETRPVCETCGLRLAERPPREEADSLVQGLDTALGEQLRRLKTEAIRQVLAQGTGDRIAKLVQAVEVASLDKLVDVLDEDLVAFITETLEMQGVGTVAADVLRRLADRYPVLEERDVPAFLAELQALLTEAFEAARAECADKRTIRISLK